MGCGREPAFALPRVAVVRVHGRLQLHGVSDVRAIAAFHRVQTQLLACLQRWLHVPRTAAKKVRERAFLHNSAHVLYDD